MAAKNPNHELQAQHLLQIPPVSPIYSEMAVLQRREFDLRQEMELEIMRRLLHPVTCYRYYTHFYKKIFVLYLEGYLQIWRMKDLLHNGRLLRLGVDYFLDVWVKAIEYTTDAVADMREIAKERIFPIIIEAGLNQCDVNATMAGKIQDMYLKENMDQQRITDFTLHIKDPDRAIPEMEEEEDE